MTKWSEAGSAMPELTDLTDNAVACLLSTNLDGLVSSRKYFFSVLLMPRSIFLTVPSRRRTDERNRTAMATRRRRLCYLPRRKGVSLPLARPPSQRRIKRCRFSSPPSDETESEGESVIGRCTPSKPYDISAPRPTSLCLSKPKGDVSNGKMELAGSRSNRRPILKTTVIYKQWCWEGEIITKRDAKQTPQAISHTLETILGELRSTHRAGIDAELEEGKASAGRR